MKNALVNETFAPPPVAAATRMDAATLEALQGSVAKWEAIVAGTGMDLGNTNCPLCAMFNADQELEPSNACRGCPVWQRTQRRYCAATPYAEEWDRASPEFGGTGDTPERKAAAQLELDFLRSLLPAP